MFAALQVLVDNCVSGLPVVDEQNRVVGVVSDFDLLALDVGGVPESRGPLFPPTDETWQVSGRRVPCTHTHIGVMRHPVRSVSKLV